jgi:hypothetical protein
MSRLGRHEHTRGLPSLNESRETRRRLTSTGKVRPRGMQPVVWLWMAVVVAVFVVVYWRINTGKLESQKSAVMAKQRAVRKTLGPKLLPFVERVETWTLELSSAGADTFQSPAIEAGLSWDALARKSGVYLRVLSTKASSADLIRRSSAVSLNDGFTSCFFVREGTTDPTKGPKCVSSLDCQAGLLCNEWDVCSAVTSPYNMRLAYRAYRSLSGEFTRALQEATEELQVRALERELDQITRVDVPVSIDVLQRAKIVTIVIDEVPTGMDKPVPFKPNETVLTDEQRVQGVPHEARVGIWDSVSGKQLVRWRGAAAGRMVSIGRRVELDPDVEGARSRQSNSCALAAALRSSIQRALGEAAVLTREQSTSVLDGPTR